MKTFRPDPCPVQEKFVQARKELSVALIERDEEIDLVLTALVCREHPLLVGPPGTGKSLLLDSLMAWLHGRRFTILFTKFTTPEEVFGPISVVGLKEDKYRRITAGKLPEADGAFGDEVFKASSAILNTLLRILNERVYDNGDGVLTSVPLRIFVAASNEWPHSQEGGKELSALFDRFLFRRTVRPILTAAGRKRLLWDRDHAPKLSTSVTPAEIDQAHADARALPWTDEAREALEAILRELAKEGIQRPPAVQVGRRGPGVRLPERRGPGRARAPGDPGQHPLGRPAGAAGEGCGHRRPHRQPYRHAGQQPAAGGGADPRGHRCEAAGPGRCSLPATRPLGVDCS